MSAEKKNAIMDAAFSCFAKNGYHETTMDDIAETAGISKGSLYWHFKSKRELYLALLDSRIKEAVRTIEGSITGSGSVRERLIKGGIAFHDFMVKDTNMASAMLGFLSEAIRDEAIRRKMGEFYSSRMSEMLSKLSYLSELDLSEDERKKIVISVMVFMHGLSLIGRFCESIEGGFEELWTFFVDRMLSCKEV